MNVSQTLALANRFTMFSGFVVIPAMLDQFSPQGTHGGHLVRVALGRHHQHAPNSKQPAGIRQRLTMVAGRAGDDSPSLLLLLQTRDEVDTATNFEGGGWRMVFVLNEISAAEQLRKSRPFIKRSGFDVSVDDWSRRQDIRVGRWIHYGNRSRVIFCLRFAPEVHSDSHYPPGAKRKPQYPSFPCRRIISVDGRS